MESGSGRMLNTVTILECSKFTLLPQGFSYGRFCVIKKITAKG